MRPLRRSAPLDAFESPTSALTLDVGLGAQSSDARQLQARAQAWADSSAANPAPPEKWSARRRIAFAVGVSLALWGGIFAIGWAILTSAG